MKRIYINILLYQPEYLEMTSNDSSISGGVPEEKDNPNICLSKRHYREADVRMKVILRLQ
jgi:hypothetical protein